jgi:hypothetical protein
MKQKKKPSIAIFGPEVSSLLAFEFLAQHNLVGDSGVCIAWKKIQDRFDPWQHFDRTGFRAKKAKKNS